MCFLWGSNGRMTNRLHSSMDHTVMTDVDFATAAAVNIEAKLIVAAKQADGKGVDKQAGSKGKGSGDHGAS